MGNEWKTMEMRHQSPAVILAICSGDTAHTTHTHARTAPDWRNACTECEIQRHRTTEKEPKRIERENTAKKEHNQPNNNKKSRLFRVQAFQFSPRHDRIIYCIAFFPFEQWIQHMRSDETRQ